MLLLDPYARPVIAHRGNRAFAPENTIEAFQQAVALGADAVEFDLRVTRDGVLVVHHDATLDRTTDGRGAIADQTVAQLRPVDAGARFSRDGSTFPWRGRGIGIPTFDDLIEALPPTLPLIVELKEVAAGPLMREAIRRHAIADRIIVAGFDSESTSPLRGMSVALGAGTTDVVKLLPRALFRRPVPRPWFQALCIPPVHHGIPVPIGALVRAVRPLGVVTHVWTVNDPAEAHRLWGLGVNGIITDDPATILRSRIGR
jgi:glycerophosphoryl diester phosphodiesterase